MPRLKNINCQKKKRLKKSNAHNIGTSKRENELTR